MTTPARALIFDMDGTIVDNMDFHTRAWITFFARRGKVIEPDAFFRDTAGRQGKEILRHYIGEDLADDELATLNHEKEALYRELYGPHRATLPGFDAFIQAAGARAGSWRWPPRPRRAARASFSTRWTCVPASTRWWSARSTSRAASRIRTSS
ncbi:HAD family hydrolase [Massilia oculi]|uniref:HAD family hydrolase n=1 Tax=Massilia oculi TaxID=945844 RepID=UPI0027D7C0EE|nr:hypothetical protein [Massilia oculi]